MTNYQPSFASALMEFSIYAFFLLMARNACRQGWNWLSTLGWGAIAGYFVEVSIVASHDPLKDLYHYDYTTELFLLHHWGVPIWLGPGWAIVLYTATWSAYRLHLPLWLGSLVAGVLAVNVDFSLEPVAHLQKFWVWKICTPLPADASVLLDQTSTWYCNPRTWDVDRLPKIGNMFGIPFDNFVAWVAIVAIFGYTVRGAFQQVELRLGADVRKKWWVDLFVPPLALFVAAAVFAALRRPVNKLYLAIGDYGQPIVFFVLFIAGGVVMWRASLRGKRTAQVNKPVLFVIVLYHVISLVIFMMSPEREKMSALWVMIPMNLTVGFFAYGWPSLDSLLRREDEPARHAEITRKTLESYSGKRIETQEIAPCNLEQLREVLGQARARGWTVSFRAGGSAFDTQSLNPDLVISLSHFSSIRVNPVRRQVTVGSGARWRDILRETLVHKLVPYVMVTTGEATAGGTLSADCLSRFSPTCGKEGHHVERFALLTPNGDLLECSREVNPEYFRAAIGGLGYVGVVLEITYGLMQVGIEPARLAVETCYTKVRGFEQIVRRLMQNTHEACGGCLRPTQTLLSETRAEPSKARALSVAMYLRSEPLGLVGVSRYVDADPKSLKCSVFHSPSSFWHVLLQLAAMIKPLRALGYFLVYRLAFKENVPKRYVDELFGYTFFEDGNRRLRRFLRWFGLPAGIRQQTFVLPAEPENTAEAERVLASFMNDSKEVFHRHQVGTALIDVLHLPDDAGEGFLLSSSNRLPGFAVTFTFSKLMSNDFADEEAALTELATVCERVKGRVHLVKNVLADSGQLDRMYETGLREMFRIREQLGGHGFLVNEFAKRVLPRIAQ